MKTSWAIETATSAAETSDAADSITGWWPSTPFFGLVGSLNLHLGVPNRSKAGMAWPMRGSAFRLQSQARARTVVVRNSCCCHQTKRIDRTY